MYTELLFTDSHNLSRVFIGYMLDNTLGFISLEAFAEKIKCVFYMFTLMLEYLLLYFNCGDKEVLFTAVLWFTKQHSEADCLICHFSSAKLLGFRSYVSVYG